MDDVKENQDSETDVSSDKSSDDAKQSSQPKFTQEDLEREVLKRVSDIQAKRGDKVKPLEERVQTLESENKTLKEAKLKDTATRFGLTVEQVKEAGIDDPSRVEALAKLFGKTTALKDDPIPDSNETLGGGKYSWETVNAMSHKELKKFKEEHKGKDLLALVEEGVIAKPK